MFHIVWPYSYPDSTVPLDIDAGSPNIVGDAVSIESAEKGFPVIVVTEAEQK